WFAYRQRLQRPYLFDLIGGVGGMGIFFGRIANFINGELVGRIAPEGTPWTIKFPQDILQWPSSSPERLASLAESAATLPEMSREKYLQLLSDIEQNPSLRGQLYGILEKIVLSIQNGNTATKTAIAGVLDARYPSQLIAAAFEGLFIFLILLAVSYKPRKPGVVGSLFLVLYASFRIFTERFRLPDAHLGFQALGLTRGQWLSIGMLLISVIIFVSYARRGGLSIPGWGRSQNIKLNRRSGSSP
ncbi:MAG: prolipoprotein diacylglyceryl transferase family protein, partial [Bdellovibrio sp.]